MRRRPSRHPRGSRRPRQPRRRRPRLLGEIVSSGVDAKLQLMLTMFEALQKTQQDTQAKLVAFEARGAAVENEEKKAKAAKRARYETKGAALARKQSVQGDAGLFGYESISDGEVP